MDFNEFSLDLLVDDREIDFLEDTPVFRPPATSTDIQKNIEFFFSPSGSSPVVFPRGFRGRDLGLHSVIRGIIILGATEVEGGGGEASFCDVQHPGSAGREGKAAEVGSRKTASA